jgi:hypothetical protein
MNYDMDIVLEKKNPNVNSFDPFKYVIHVIKTLHEIKML